MVARSNYIYIAEDGDFSVGGHGILAAFTVKHELMSWLERFDWDACGVNKHEVVVWRIQDGADVGLADKTAIPRGEWDTQTGQV